MIHHNFAWTFAIDDRYTVSHVRNRFIPQLKAEVQELKRLNAECKAAGLWWVFDNQISDKTDELNAAEARLRLAGRTSRLTAE